MQEALLAALIAINKYDDERTWSLSSWVYYCVQANLSKKIKSENKYIYYEMPQDEIEVAKAIEAKRKAELLGVTNRRYSTAAHPLRTGYEVQ